MRSAQPHHPGWRQGICTRQMQFKRSRLAWRKSGGAYRSLAGFLSLSRAASNTEPYRCFPMGNCQPTKKDPPMRVLHRRVRRTRRDFSEDLPANDRQRFYARSIRIAGHGRSSLILSDSARKSGRQSYCDVNLTRGVRIVERSAVAMCCHRRCIAGSGSYREE